MDFAFPLILIRRLLLNLSRLFFHLSGLYQLFYSFLILSANSLFHFLPVWASPDFLSFFLSANFFIVFLPVWAPPTFSYQPIFYSFLPVWAPPAATTEVDADQQKDNRNVESDDHLRKERILKNSI